MQRHCHDTIELSDGTRLPKGSRFYVPASILHDPVLYPDPYKMDAKRWLRMREEPGNQNRYQWVTTLPEHIGFGHGKHACPGRFFASSEIKLVLIHLVMKYDWVFKDGKRPDLLFDGQDPRLDPEAEIVYTKSTPLFPCLELGTQESVA
jgi:cytochrome P450